MSPREPQQPVDAEFEEGPPPPAPPGPPAGLARLMRGPFDFCRWLEGYLDALGGELSREQLATVRARLDESLSGPVFVGPVPPPFVAPPGFPGGFPGDEYTPGGPPPPPGRPRYPRPVR